MGIDRVELRRRNHIQPDADALQDAAGTVYDSGDFTAVLDQALSVADWDGLRRAPGARAARAASCAGAASATISKCTAPPTKEMGGIRFEADGTVTIITGTLDYGQGHASPVRPGAVATGSACRSSASACCRATATS